jgi:hypothetical protein
MKVTKIKVSIGRTINLGNYESARIDIGAEADIGDEDFHVDLELLHRLLVKELAGRITKGEY